MENNTQTMTFNEFRMQQINAYYSSVGSYRHLMTDRIRNLFYEKSIKYSCKNKVVLDLGAGLGLLSLYAARAGAKKIYAVEANPVAVEILKKLKETEKLDNLEIIQSASWNLTLPEQVDVIVHEIFGPFLLDEMCIHALEDVKKWLKPEGILLPDSFGFDFKFYDSDNIDSINQLSQISRVYEDTMQTGQVIIEDVIEDNYEDWINFGPWKFYDYPKDMLLQTFKFSKATRIDSLWVKPFIMAQGARLDLYRPKIDRHWGNSFLRFGQYTVMEEKTDLEMSFQIDENMASFKTGVNIPKHLPDVYNESAFRNS